MIFKIEVAPRSKGEDFLSVYQGNRAKKDFARPPGPKPGRSRQAPRIVFAIPLLQGGREAQTDWPTWILFNKRDYVAAERFWSPQYIQHSAHIESGRDGLFSLIKAAPPSLKYEPGVVLAEGDYVILHGRFSNIGLPVNWIAADVVRLKGGILVEH